MVVGVDEIGDAVSVMSVGIAVVSACALHSVNHLHGRFVGEELPEAGHHAGEDRSREGGAVGGIHLVGGSHHDGLRADGQPVGLDTPVVGRSVGGEVGNLVVAPDSPYCEDAVGIGGTGDVFPLLSSPAW